MATSIHGGGLLSTAIETTSGHEVYVDLFGGSGYLANTIKKRNPKSRVIWNDYDNYAARLGALSATENIRQQLSRLLDGIPRKDSVKKHPEKFSRLLEYLAALPDETDWITLGTWLIFSGKYAVSKRDLITKINQSCWNNLVKNPLHQGDYLNRVERVSVDWREVLSNYGRLSDVCLIVDPPYLYTDNRGYSNEITAQDTLDLFTATLKNNSFMLFTTGRLDIVNLIMQLDKKMATATGKIVRKSKINGKMKNHLSEVCYYK